LHCLTASNVARQQLDEVAVIRLASGSGLFALFKCNAANQSSEQSLLVYNISQQFS